MTKVISKNLDHNWVQIQILGTDHLNSAFVISKN